MNALVSEPRWKRSSIVTGISWPARRVPQAPEAMITPSLKTAAASAGRPNSLKYGQVSD